MKYYPWPLNFYFFYQKTDECHCVGTGFINIYFEYVKYCSDILHIYCNEHFKQPWHSSVRSDSFGSSCQSTPVRSVLMSATVPYSDSPVQDLWRVSNQSSNFHGSSATMFYLDLCNPPRSSTSLNYDTVPQMFQKLKIKRVILWN